MTDSDKVLPQNQRSQKIYICPHLKRKKVRFGAVNHFLPLVSDYAGLGK